ncbi:hypothetical protein ACIQ9Q_17280 [Streptomyces sp. NPDC094438]|uniref:hypothetical protein n=1 Tax=Streptomyces sp. NPDC094438 TaxID=3366061 RepID=UPI0038254D02
MVKKLTDVDLACIKYLHGHGGCVSQGEGFSITTVRKLEEAGIVTVDQYVTDALYEARGKTWIATITPDRLAMAKEFAVSVTWGFRRWFEATRLMEPFESDKRHENDMTRAVRDAWWGSLSGSKDAEILTAPMAVLTSIEKMASGALGLQNPYNMLEADDGQAFLDAVAALK